MTRLASLFDATKKQRCNRTIGAALALVVVVIIMGFFNVVRVGRFLPSDSLESEWKIHIVTNNDHNESADISEEVSSETVESEDAGALHVLEFPHDKRNSTNVEPYPRQFIKPSSDQPSTGTMTEMPQTTTDAESIPSNSNNNHILQDEYLPLLPWEEASITGSCEPPPGIPSSCCLRSTTKGSGQPVAFSPNLCTTNTTKYHFVETKAAEYLQQHTIPPNAVGCDVCRILQLLQTRNWTTLMFTGDSMSRQTFEGYKCELFRRGYNVQVNFERPFGKDPNIKSFRYGIREKTTLTFPGGEFADIKIIFYIMYQATPKSIQQFMLKTPDNPEGADVYVFDHSLWYRHWEVPKFITEMTAALRVIQESQDPPKLIVWREQSAQHFSSPGGSFSPGYAAKNHSKWGKTNDCQPIDPSNMEEYTILYQHDVAMKNVSAALGMNFITSPDQLLIDHTLSSASSASNLYVIPYRDFMSPFYDIHRQGECTHYCSAPGLWMPIARMLRLYMEKYVALERQKKVAR